MFYLYTLWIPSKNKKKKDKKWQYLECTLPCASILKCSVAWWRITIGLEWWNKNFPHARQIFIVQINYSLIPHTESIRIKQKVQKLGYFVHDKSTDFENHHKNEYIFLHEVRKKLELTFM